MNEGQWFDATRDCVVCGFDHTCAHCSGSYKSWLNICPMHPPLKMPAYSEMRAVERSLR